MIHCKIFTVGKTKEKWLEDALKEYIKRLQPYLQIEWYLAKNSTQLHEWVIKEPHLIALDPEGLLFKSEQFATFIEKQWIQHGGRLSFVIGGAEGLSESLKKHSLLISLSPLTFTHQLTRLIFVEQLYRSIEILKGSSYHK